jgi:WD40 repeat protein
LSAGGDAMVVSTSGDVSLRDVVSGNPLDGGSFRVPGGCPSYLANSPDGRYLVAWDICQLRVFDIAENALRWQCEGSEASCVAYHPQAGLVVARGDEIVELSLETGTVLRRLLRHTEQIRHLTFDAAGDRLAFLDWRGGIKLCRVRDGASLWHQKFHGAGTLPATHRPILYSPVLSFSADGHHLVTCAYEGEWVLAIWDTKRGERLRTLRGHDQVINGAAFLPDGTLASWSSDGTFRLWNVKRSVVRRIITPLELAASGV